MASEAARQAAQMNTFRAGQMLEKAEWAASAFATYGREAVLRLAEAAAEAGAGDSERYAKWAVEETGFGNPDHKAVKNRQCSRGIFDHYRDHDLTGYRVDEARKIVEVARPAGVVFALTPSTNPVASVFYKIMLALLSRNAIVISPHPAAKACCSHAAHLLREAAESAGAPEGVIQVVDEPELELIDTIMRSPKTRVILATGGSPMVRAAYSSGNPALGVGPGNCPAYVDAGADPARAAKHIVDSKAFDNSVLCTNESAVIAHEAVAERLAAEMTSQGAHICNGEERARVEEALFPAGRFNVGMLGKPAEWIAEQCRIRVRRGTRVLVVPLERIGDDYPLSREKLCPVLGFYEVKNAEAGMTAARAMVRKSGGGHSAAIHTDDPRVSLRFGAELNVLRIAVNAPCSTGAAGFETHLAPTMTVGTGFFGRSAVGENVRPDHLVQWVRVAYNKDPGVAFPDFQGLPLPAPGPAHGPAADAGGDPAADLRAEILQIVREELRNFTDHGGR